MDNQIDGNEESLALRTLIIAMRAMGHGVVMRASGEDVPPGFEGVSCATCGGNGLVMMTREGVSPGMMMLSMEVHEQSTNNPS